MSTQNAGNWPDPERPDVPMFPERDGKHVINIDAESTGLELVYYWKAGHQVWVEYEHCSEDEALDGNDLMGWSYVGPCLTPEQIAEMLAAERERCAKICDVAGNFAKNEEKSPDSHEIKRCWCGERCAAIICADMIRNLGGAR